MTDRIGFVGLGNMGVPMARNLAKRAAHLVALDPSEDQRSQMKGIKNVTTTDNLHELGGCNIVVLMLPNGAIVRDVLIGSGKLNTILPNNALVIDMSSSDPQIYDDIKTHLESYNIDIIDAPVSGNVSGAENATLTIMTGGSRAAVTRANPVLTAMGKTIFYLGDLGSGQTMKALNNLLSAGGLIMAAEVLLTAKAAGLDPKQVNDILNVSTGRNNSTERKIEPFVLSEAYNSGFGLSLMAKDLRTAAAIAQRANVQLPIGSHVVNAANAAETQLGQSADHTEVARWLSEMTGVPFGITEKT